jgi:hypothetical protein
MVNVILKTLKPKNNAEEWKKNKKVSSDPRKCVSWNIQYIFTGWYSQV